jgi:hypothetical protein
LFTTLAKGVLGHRAAVALALALVVAGTLAGILHLQADFSAVAFYGSGDREVAHLLDFKERWGADDSMILVLLEADGDGMVTPTRMRALAELTEVLDRHPDIAEVASITSTPILVGESRGGIDLSPVIESMPPASGPEFDAWRTRLLAHPVAVPLLLAADGSTAALAVTLDVNADDIVRLRPIVDTLRALLEPFEG